MRVAVAFTLFVSVSVAAAAAYAQTAQRPRRPSRRRLRQSGCARRSRARRDRHHRRSRLRLRAFQAARLPARQRSGADLRRRPVAGQHPAVLKALADHCIKAIFFPIGKHAIWHPEILKQVAAAGHTIGTHTWSHRNLAGMQAIEGQGRNREGLSAVTMALGRPGAPFFRFPALQHPPELVTYLGERNVAHLLDRHGLVRLQDAQARAGDQVRAWPS